MAASVTMRLPRWLTLAAAIALLDISVTFENLWPTPAVTWYGQLSMELAIAVMVLAIASKRFGPPGRRTLAWLGAAWLVLVIGRYAEVTAPALYGRDINLYWDLRFIPDVVAMVTRVAQVWLIAVSVAVIILVVAALYRALRSAWRRIGSAMNDRRERRVLVVFSSVVTVLFVGQHVSGGALPFLPVATPVTPTYARQIRFVIEARSGSTSLPASPPMDSDLERVKGADVFLIFVEAYGATSYQRADIAAPLAASRAQFEAAVRDTHRDVVSAFVESPTFGGSSWLAHLSLVSGLEVRDPDTNARLMAERRDTLVRAFGRHGFRTVALMPGLRQKWPEGVFYGFDEIYGADRLGYRGPEFGWFAIPDQFALDRLNALEVNRTPRPPLFVFFPTISTHFPFSPTPPYQPDWRRLSTGEPYDGPAIVRAYAREPDWMNFAPGYVDALTYDYASIAGYLRTRADADLVVIMIGDHQPAAVVSGEGASWEVPVHIIASRPAVLDRLRAGGFRTGLTPEEPAIGPMHALLPLLLDAFGDR